LQEGHGDRGEGEGDLLKPKLVVVRRVDTEEGLPLD
jgi:hypothetical protein